MKRIRDATREAPVAGPMSALALRGEISLRTDSRCERAVTPPAVWLRAELVVAGAASLIWQQLFGCGPDGGYFMAAVALRLALVRWRIASITGAVLACDNRQNWYDRGTGRTSVCTGEGGAPRKWISGKWRRSHTCNGATEIIESPSERAQKTGGSVS
jgi:hypothetical protein